MAIKVSGTTVIDDSRNLGSVGIVTVGSGNSVTTINGNTGIINVGTGVTINAQTGDINTTGIVTVGQLVVPITVSSFDPAIGSTSVGVSSNIIINFNQTVGFGTTGFIDIHTGLNTTGGTLVERVGIGSARVTLDNGGRRLSIDPTANFGFISSFHLTMSGGFVAANGTNFAGINTVGSATTYYFRTKALALGDSYEGGFLICCASPVRWVVSPRSAEVSRNWYSRGDAATTAQQVSGCTGWFIPTCAQLQNPGYCCRSFWGPSPCYSSTTYWSSSEASGFTAFNINFNTGSGNTFNYNKADPCCVRAFRCVTY